MTTDAAGHQWGTAYTDREHMLSWKPDKDRERRSAQIMEEGQRYLSAQDKATIKAGEEALRERRPNRDLSKPEYDAWLAWLQDARADQKAVDVWGLRGQVSGSPHDRLEIAGNAEPDEGPDWEACCEHGFSGKHSRVVDGERVACQTTPVFPGDYWLQPSYAPSVAPERVVRDDRRGLYPRVNPFTWGAAEDAIEALMEETPHATHDGGGLTGVEDEYWLARAAMMVDPPAGEIPEEEASA